VDPSAPGWYPDPYGRHEHRYWSGIRWSRHVDDGGYRTEDPLDTGPVATMPLERPPERVERPREGASPFGPRSLDPVAGGQWRGGHDTGRRDIGSRDLGSQRALGRDRGPGPEWEFGASGPRRHFTDDDEPRRAPLALMAGTLAVVVAAVGAFVLFGRGGDGGDAGNANQTQADPLYSRLLEVMHEKSGDTIDDEQAHCMADAIVDTAGRDRLIELGVTDGADPILALDSATKDIGIPKAFECLDDQAMINFMASTFERADVGLPAGMGPCVIDTWFKKLGRERLLFLYSTLARVDPPPITETLNENEMQVVTDSFMACNPANSSTTAAA